MSKQHRVIVLGAGFAGLMTAIRLSRKAKQERLHITLINATDEFVQRIHLHEWAANQTRQWQKIEDLLSGTGVDFVQGWVTRLQAEHNSVLVAQGDEQVSLFYDTLVMALGSRVDTTSVKGVADYAYTLDANNKRGAEALRTKLLNYQNRDGHVVIIGGGATGIEGATHIKSLYPHLQVTMITRTSLGDFKDDARVEHGIQTAFAEQNIAVRNHSSVREVTENTVILASGESIAFDVCLWAGGFIAPTLGREAGLACNEQNQILIDPYQRSLNYPNILAVGDCAFPVEIPGNPYRMCCPVAMTMGAHAADTINRMVDGKDLHPLSFDYYGQGIQLGTDDAIGWMGYPDDKVRLIVTRGTPALLIRKSIFAMVDRIFDWERDYGVYSWTGKNRYAKQQEQMPQPEPISEPVVS